MEDQNQSLLGKYTVNLTDKAKQRKLDPVIGRDSEIRRVMQVLSRRTKNNPVLIGDPGVGKTALVEGLASRIVHGDVPDSIKGKDILILDIATVLAGAAYRGEFEKRIKYLVKHGHNFIKFSNLSSLAKDKMSKPTILYFDDGFKDNLTNVLPILIKYKIPATFFISTGLIIVRVWASQNMSTE